MVHNCRSPDGGGGSDFLLVLMPLQLITTAMSGSNVICVCVMQSRPGNEATARGRLERQGRRPRTVTVVTETAESYSVDSQQHRQTGEKVRQRKR